MNRPSNRACILARLPGSLAAVAFAALVGGSVWPRATGLVVLYGTLPLAVAAVELVACLPQPKLTIGLEFAFGLWFLVLTETATAFVHFGVAHGLTALAVVVVVADVFNSGARVLS